MPPKLTQVQVIEKVKNIDDGSYRILSDYISSTQPIKILHTSCGTEYIAKRAKTFLQEKGNRCIICQPQVRGHSTAIVSENELKRRIYSQVKDEYTYLNGYSGVANYINIIHNKCGTIYKVTPSLFLGIKQRRCPECAKISRGMYLRDTNYLQNILDKSLHGNEYIWLNNTYKYDNKIKYKIKHIKCGHIYLVRPNDFQQGYRCPLCATNKKESYLSSRLTEILTENNITFKKEVKFKNLKNIFPLRFDYYIKDLNLLIEVDGEQHFKINTFDRSIESFSKTVKRDILKNLWVMEHSIHLLRIKYSLPENNIINIVKCIMNNTLTEYCKQNDHICYISGINDILFNTCKYYDTEDLNHIAVDKLL